MKNFDEWNEMKKSIDYYSGNKFYKEREVWWCSLGINIGHEQNGGGEKHLRPMLVLKYLSRETCFAIPLTSSKSTNVNRIKINNRNSVVLSQMRIVDTKRFVERMMTVDESIYLEIRKAVKEMF